MSERTPILDPALESPFEVVDDPTAKTWDQQIEEAICAYRKAQERKAAQERRTRKKPHARKATGS